MSSIVFLTYKYVYFIQLNIICDMKNISVVIHKLYVQLFASINLP